MQMNSNRRDFLKAARFMGAGLFISSGLTCSVSKGRGIPEYHETSPADLLGQDYNLAGERKQEPQNIDMETKLVYFNEEGKS